ncbi:hypothetical protein BDN71DRAFT_858044 [Pleurotus eryngii]|uniref:Uncharacterized protein n=1 Tax=Pleurotus eryngii TaxID=5323 RepID=A0A9P5ZZM9_PLEER|nr:hypothetical protein BDN71DRAFT_858044 [Pleurotus eryngii]
MERNRRGPVGWVPESLLRSGRHFFLSLWEIDLTGHITRNEPKEGRRIAASSEDGPLLESISVFIFVLQCTYECCRTARGRPTQEHYPEYIAYDFI